MSNFKVIIVGGGVAGLTLSLTLAKAGIDYVLLEAHREFAPYTGASIAVFPNGAKTLDQLGGGVLDDLYRVSSPIAHGFARDDAGKIMYYINMERCADRYGYPAGFLPRRKLLELLYRHVPDKSKLLPGKRVSRIVHSETDVRVTTEDGEEFRGDVVIGADGTHSVVRREVWDLADKLKPGLITEEERNTLSAEYCAVVGISAPVPGVPPDSSNMNHNSGHSSIIISGMDGQIFWFLFEKMDQKYAAPDIPRFTKEDGRRVVEKRLKSPVTETVLFEEVWKGTETFDMVPMEEGLFKHQHFGRMAIIGDAAHKVTINLGLGANSTIESATALTNGLYKALKAHPEGGLDSETIGEIFRQMQTDREASVKSLDIAASVTTRVHAWATPKLKFMSKYLVQYFKGEDFVWDGQNDIQRRTAKLDFLPDPDKGAIPMVYSSRNPEERGKVATLAVYSLPVMALVGYRQCVSNWVGNETIDLVSRAAKESGVPDLGVYSRFLGFGLTKVLTCCFQKLSDLLHDHDQQLDAGHRLFALQVILGLFPILTIWIIEGLRRGNSMTFSKIPAVWGLLAQIFSAGAIIPLYFFAHAYQITPTRYYERNFISIPTTYAKTLIPTLVISFLLPTAILLLGQDHQISYKQSLALWLPYPIYVSAVHQLLRFPFPTPSKARKGADLPYLRGAYALSFVVSASAHLFTLYSYLYKYSFTYVLDYKQPSPLAFTTIRSEYLVAFTAGLVWVLVLFGDVKRFRKTSASWLAMLGSIMVGSVVVGPAATVIAAYALREEALRA